MVSYTNQIQVGQGVGDGFSDVHGIDWFAPYVDAAVEANLVQGISATEFGPDDTITREQMAVLFSRALQLTTIGATNGVNMFEDSSAISNWAQADVQAAVGGGYRNGFPDGSSQPQGDATRAQAARVIVAVQAGLLQ